MDIWQNFRKTVLIQAWHLWEAWEWLCSFLSWLVWNFVLVKLAMQILKRLPKIRWNFCWIGIWITAKMFDDYQKSPVWIEELRSMLPWGVCRYYAWFMLVSIQCRFWYMTLDCRAYYEYRTFWVDDILYAGKSDIDEATYLLHVAWLWWTKIREDEGRVTGSYLNHIHG